MTRTDRDRPQNNRENVNEALFVDIAAPCFCAVAMAEFFISILDGRVPCMSELHSTTLVLCTILLLQDYVRQRHLVLLTYEFVGRCVV